MSPIVLAFFFSIEEMPTIPFKKIQYISYLVVLKFNSTFQKNKTFSSFKKFRSFFHRYCVFFSIEDLPTIPFKKIQYISYLDILKYNSTFQKNKRLSSFKKFQYFFHCHCVFSRSKSYKQFRSRNSNTFHIPISLNLTYSFPPLQLFSA